MPFSFLTSLLWALCFLVLVAAQPLDERQSTCTFAKKKAAIAAEIKTIGSHSAADAALIPLNPLASRTFFVTPRELGGSIMLPPINVGVTADTVRSELVGLATALDAGVPSNSIKYINNANGTVTSDFIQTDRIVLPREQVREIHTFDSQCRIKTIIGYVNGPLSCPTTSTNTVLQTICSEYAAAGGT